MKRKKIIIINLFIFLLFLILYLLNKVHFIDRLFYQLIITMKSNPITIFMKCITFFGSVKFIAFSFILILLLNFILKKKSLTILNITILICSAINYIIKIIIRRQRPIDINLIIEDNYSFPSGHTMIAVCFYGFIIYLIKKSNINKNLKKSLISLLIILIILIMISRIYLGVHYASDVLAGLSLGIAILFYILDYMERTHIK